jgi:hypothetical protein
MWDNTKTVHEEEQRLWTGLKKVYIWYVNMVDFIFLVCENKVLRKVRGHKENEV